MVSSFGADHDGELLLLNYSRGHRRPDRPGFRRWSRRRRSCTRTLRPAQHVETGRRDPTGVTADGYVVERVRSTSWSSVRPNGDGRARHRRCGDCVHVRCALRDGTNRRAASACARKASWQRAAGSDRFAMLNLTSRMPPPAPADAISVQSRRHRNRPANAARPPRLGRVEPRDRETRRRRRLVDGRPRRPVRAGALSSIES